MVATSTPEIKRLRMEAVEKTVNKSRRAKKKLFSVELSNTSTEAMEQRSPASKPGKKVVQNKRDNRNAKKNTFRPDTLNKSTEPNEQKRPAASKTAKKVVQNKKQTKPRPISCQPPPNTYRKPIWLANMNNSGRPIGQQRVIVADAQSAMTHLPNNDQDAQCGLTATAEQSVTSTEAVFQPAVEERNINTKTFYGSRQQVRAVDMPTLNAGRVRQSEVGLMRQKRVPSRYNQ